MTTFAFISGGINILPLGARVSTAESIFISGLSAENWNGKLAWLLLLFLRLEPLFPHAEAEVMLHEPWVDFTFTFCFFPNLWSLIHIMGDGSSRRSMAGGLRHAYTTTATKMPHGRDQHTQSLLSHF